MSSRKTYCWTTLVASMTRNRFWQGFRALLLLVVAGGLVACDRGSDFHEVSGYTMGTDWSVQFYGLPAGASVSEVQDDLEHLLEMINRQMSIYREDSDITGFNRARAGESRVLPPDFYRVLTTALQLAEDTGGAFDPTVGPLVELWGFGSDGRRSAPPTEEEIQEILPKVGWERVELDHETRELTQPGDLYLDVAAVAKGHAVDRLADYLDARGVASYLVSIGGDMRARGSKPGGEPWRVAVERPQAGTREIQRVVNPRNTGLASSGDYRNFLVHEGKEYPHLIDARTGYPVDHGLASVSVLHSRAKMADGLATALAVLGPEKALEFAEQQGLAVFLVERTGDGFREHMTPEFALYLDEEMN